MDEATTGGATPILNRPGVRQFVKFCIVGFSSLTVDVAVSSVLHYLFHLPIFVAKSVSFCLGVTNGFIWNQRWTFRAVGHRRHHEQYAMFLGVNIVGYLLNLGIVMTVIRLTTGTWNPAETPKPIFAGATLLAAAVVVFWNFFANKHWTFKRPGE